MVERSTHVFDHFGHNHHNCGLDNTEHDYDNSSEYGFEVIYHFTGYDF